uniref:Uncharacterized protein n=1 Tax=viral metagenome TaxID=1070528 RepID=A0A6C0EMQ5_9ZZZZ
MNRKLLNEARKAMSRKKFLRKLVGDQSKSFRPNVSSDESRLVHTVPDKECINKLKSLSK